MEGKFRWIYVGQLVCFNYYYYQLFPTFCTESCHMHSLAKHFHISFAGVRSFLVRGRGQIDGQEQVNGSVDHCEFRLF